MAEIPDIAYLEAQLKKRWKKRVVLWTFFLLIVATLYKAQISGAIYLFLLILFILLDEKLKEGYFVKKSDFKKPLTHEFFIVIVVFAWVIALFSKKLRRLKK